MMIGMIAAARPVALASHMDNYEEQGHDRQDHDRGRVFEPEANYDLIGHPGSGFSRKQGSASEIPTPNKSTVPQFTL